MSISSFNKGLDDAYMGNCPRAEYQNNIDYLEGFQMGEDIEARREYEESMRKAQEEDYYNELREDKNEYYERLRREEN